MKYKKTPHLPWSENLQNDDKMISTLDFLNDQNVIYTIKLDGECTYMGEKIHARSEENDSHKSRDWVKALYGSIKHLIPNNLAIFGENVFAKHSIYYNELTSFFYVFNIVDKDKKVVLSIDETLKICHDLGLEYVPILYRGKFNKDFKIPYSSYFGGEIEGYVVRVEKEFPFNDFNKYSAKIVRKNHVQTGEHWKKTWVPNKLLKDDK